MCRPSSGCLEYLSDYTLRVVPFCGGGRDLALQHETWKLVKIEINSNMFRFTQEPSSGSYNQCLAKIMAAYVAITLTMSAPTRTVEQDL